MKEFFGSDGPGFATCDFGSASLSAFCWLLNVVDTIKKMSTTSSTSMSDTMMTEGVRRRLFLTKFMRLLDASLRQRSNIIVFGAVMFAQEFVAKIFHFDAEILDLLRVVIPADQGRNRDQQAHQRCAQCEADAIGEVG